MRTNPEIPMTPAPGLLLVLSAPSGAGKTTLARRLEKEFPRAQFSISYTTRDPRGQEQNGVDYHFVDARTFLQMVNRGDFIEWAEVHDNYYGTSRGIVDSAFATRGIAVFDIDVKGGLAIKSKFPGAVGEPTRTRSFTVGCSRLVPRSKKASSNTTTSSSTTPSTVRTRS
jgi:guanylate kinase